MAKLSTFGFRFKSLSLPEIEEVFDESMQTPLKTAVTRSLADVSTLAKLRLRQQVRMRFRNRLTGKARFEKAFNAWAYPDKNRVSLQPAATIQANPAWADIFEHGMPKTVSPALQRFLAIPTAEAEKLGLDKIGAGRGWNRHLSQTRGAKAIGETAVVKTDKGLFLTARKGDETLFLFKLVRQVREPEKLSLNAIAESSMGRLPGLFSMALEKATK